MSDYSWLLGTGAFISSIGLLAYLRGKKTKNKEYSNPSVQGVNRLDPHSVLCGFTNEEDARRFVLQPYVHLRWSTLVLVGPDRCSRRQ